MNVVAAVIERDGTVLICQRKTGQHYAGKWEFPGGKREDGETLEQCLCRELQEELAIRARPIGRLTVVEHDYPHVQLRLHPFVCEHEEGEPQHLECQATHWIDPPQLRGYRFPPANEKLIDEVVEYLAKRAREGEAPAEPARQEPRPTALHDLFSTACVGYGLG